MQHGSVDGGSEVGVGLIADKNSGKRRSGSLGRCVGTPAGTPGSSDSEENPGTHPSRTTPPSANLVSTHLIYVGHFFKDLPTSVMTHSTAHQRHYLLFCFLQTSRRPGN